MTHIASDSRYGNELSMAFLLSIVNEGVRVARNVQLCKKNQQSAIDFSRVGVFLCSFEKLPRIEQPHWSATRPIGE